MSSKGTGKQVRATSCALFGSMTTADLRGKEEYLFRMRRAVLESLKTPHSPKRQTPSKESMIANRPKPRCAHRDRRIAWCNLLAKFCDAPNEYETCPHYKPRK